jgi:hypothetical protein
MRGRDGVAPPLGPPTHPRLSGAGRALRVRRCWRAVGGTEGGGGRPFIGRSARVGRASVGRAGVGGAGKWMPPQPGCRPVAQPQRRDSTSHPVISRSTPARSPCPVGMPDQRHDSAFVGARLSEPLRTPGRIGSCRRICQRVSQMTKAWRSSDVSSKIVGSSGAKTTTATASRLLAASFAPTRKPWPPRWRREGTSRSTGSLLQIDPSGAPDRGRSGCGPMLHLQPALANPSRIAGRPADIAEGVPSASSSGTTSTRSNSSPRRGV